MAITANFCLGPREKKPQEMLIVDSSLRGWDLAKLGGNWGSAFRSDIRHKWWLFFTASATEELASRFPNGLLAAQT